MALFEGKTPAERNKIIAAGVFGVVALALLLRMFFGGPSSTTTPTNANRRQTAANRPTQANPTGEPEVQIDTPPEEVIFRNAAYTGGEPGRNIFALYTPPPPSAQTPPPTPEPTPTPTPPVMLASLSPQSVYAQTGEFKLQVTGDKFTPAVRVYFAEQEVPTQFAGPQQLTATIPPHLINVPGSRVVSVRTPDNQLYSNAATLNVMQPPAPNFTYIGYINPTRANSDKAILKDQKNDLLTVQVNDIVGGRFRVTGITARAVELTDKDLKIKHTLVYTDARAAGATGPVPRGAITPPPRTDDDDEEP